MFRRFIVSFVVVLLLVSSCFVGLSFASPFVVDEYTGTGSYQTPTTQHPSANGSASAVYVQFTPAYNCYLYSAVVELSLYTDSSPVFTVGCEVLGFSGGLANATVFEESSTVVSSSALGGSMAEFTFSFAGTTALVEDANYSLAVFIDVFTSGSGGVHVLVNNAGVATRQSGNYANSAWDNHTYDIWFKVYGSESYGGAGEGDTSTSDTDSTISSLMWWFIYLVVMLAPAWFLGGYLKMGKWGFVIGLAIGTGIGYAFLTGFPMWLLILVAVGEAGLVYSTVSREG